MRRLKLDQARRIALEAQGFADPAPGGRVDVRHLRRALRRMGLLQIDSVNVVVRSHYMPLFSRLGPYPMDLIDDMAYGRRELFEYWGHEASFLPVERYPLFVWKMKAIKPGRRVKAVFGNHPEYVDRVLEEVRRRGGLTVSELTDPGERTGPWWGHGRGKTALEWHFAKGNLTVTGRRNFARVYDLPERFFPAEVLAAEAPERDDACRQLLLLSARHHGVGTASDLADYYRLHPPTARAMLRDLAAEGLLEQVEVQGWDRPTYLHPEARLPRSITGSALLTPFDPVVWHRHRAETLFGFHYRIEIYVPRPKRIYGYYVMPFLLDGELVGRVDLKADRSSRDLLVRGAFCEPDQEPRRVATAMAPHLQTMAEWLGLHRVRLERRGNLMGDLRRLL